MFHPSFSVDLAALNAAQQAYLDTLAEVRKHNLSHRSMLQQIQSRGSRLNQQRTTLEQLAGAGRINEARTQLAVFLHEWAQLQALQDTVHNGKWLNPTQVTIQAFWQRLNSEHVWLANQLLFSWQQGQQAQASDASRLVQRQVQAADDALYHIGEHTQRVHHQNLDLIQAVRDAHSDARTSLDEARLASETMLDFAAQVQQTTVDMLDLTSEQAYQSLPDVLEEQRSQRVAGRLRTMLILGGIFIGILVLFYLCIQLGLV